MADSYYKEVTEGTTVLRKETALDQDQHRSNQTLDAHELPSRLVAIETPLHRFVHEERTKGDSLDVKVEKLQLTSDRRQPFLVKGPGFLLALSDEPQASIDRATYAGIECDLQWIPDSMRFYALRGFGIGTSFSHARLDPTD